MKRVSWALAVLVLSPVAFAQTEPSPAQTQPLPIFRAGVDLLEVDVSIVDDDGNPVADLVGSDFEVSVDGEPRSVASAQFVDLRTVGSISPEGAANQSDLFYSTNTTGDRARLIMIAVDRENIAFGEGRHVMKAASAFIDTLGSHDKVSLVTVPPPGPFIDFTSDHRRVQDELEQLVGIGNDIGLFADQFRLGVSEAMELARSQGFSALAAVALRRLCDADVTEFVDECENEALNQAYLIHNEVQRQAEASITMLEEILDHLSEIDGPKSLIWISEGLMTETAVELGRLVSPSAAARTSVNVIMIDDFGRLDMTQDGFGPTEGLDRDMRQAGLHALASFTGGTVSRVMQIAEPAFERIERELSGYYLLGVEPLPEDLDGAFHEIDVSVDRPGASVRSHREFRHQPVDESSSDTEDRLRRTLSSPVVATDLPLRVATYTYQDPASANVRVLVVTDVERDEYGPADVMFGYQLITPDGEIVAGRAQRATLEPVDGPQGPVLEQLAAFVVEPGEYTLKLAAVEHGGRRGSLEHRVDAQQLSGQRFAMGDLVLATAPTDVTARVRPPVETRVEDDLLMAYLELYTNDPVHGLGETRVQIEVDGDSLDETLIAEVGEPRSSDGGSAHVVSAVIPVHELPPGSYVARAIVTEGGRELGRRTRPFEVARDPERAARAGGEILDGEPIAMETADLGSAEALSMMLSAPARFQPGMVLSPELLDFFLDVVDREYPDVAATTARMRRGDFDGAAEAVFDSAPPAAAAFLGGLEFFAEGEVNRAGTQFSVALREEPNFAPPAFYLGAAYATAGRGRDAVRAWRRALLADDIAPEEYALLCDTLTRLGDINQTIPVLREALTIWPENDGLRRRLAMAQAVAGLYGAALETVEPYLVKHPSDHEALLVAVHSLYAQYEIGGLVMTPGDRTRMARYAEAYSMIDGPNAAIVSTWAASVASAP